MTQSLFKDTQGSHKVTQKRPEKDFIQTKIPTKNTKQPQPTKWLYKIKNTKNDHKETPKKPTNAKPLHMTQNNFKVRQNLLTDKQIYHKVTENNDKLQLWLYSQKKCEKKLQKICKVTTKRKKISWNDDFIKKKKEHKEKKQPQGYAKMTTNKTQMCNKVTQNHIGTQNVLKWHRATTKQHITLKIHEKNNNKEKWNDNKKYVL